MYPHNRMTEVRWYTYLILICLGFGISRTIHLLDVNGLFLLILTLYCFGLNFLYKRDKRGCNFILIGAILEGFLALIFVQLLVLLRTLVTVVLVFYELRTISIPGPNQYPNRANISH